MKKKVFAIFASFFLSFVQAFTPILAEENGLDFTLTQETRNQDGVLIQNPTKKDLQVFDGSVINHSVLMNNIGQTCYARVNIDCNALSDKVEIHFADNWIEKPDGYWYYTEKINTKDSITVFDSVKFASDIEEEAYNQDVYELIVKANVEVIDDSIEPAFDTDDPWFFYAEGINKLESSTMLKLPAGSTGVLSQPIWLYGSIALVLLGGILVLTAFRNWRHSYE
jgi:hypothetical protein